MDELVIYPRHWYAWQEFPDNADFLCPGTPVFITSVEPLGTGQGILRLGLILALHVVTPRARILDLRVRVRQPSYLVGTFRDAEASDERLFTGVLSRVDNAWLAKFASGYLERVPCHRLLPYEPSPKAEDYLSSAIGDSAETILKGATSESFPVEKPPLPTKVTRINLDKRYSLLDSFLIRRGFVPREMEDKWFIYFEGDRLFMRRSWTGFLIYEVIFEELGEVLRSDHAIVSRDPAQYAATDDLDDKLTIEYLIDALLLGKGAEFPESNA